MGLFDETAKFTAGQDPVDTSTSGLGSLAAKAVQKAVDDEVLNTNTVNTPLSDLKSIIVRDPSMVDPSFDISGVRTTTPTRSELLAAVPEFSGFEFDPTQRSYIEDLYALYAGGVPTRDVAMGDTAQIPGAVDTLVNVGEGESGATLPGFDVDSPKNTLDGLTQSGTFAGQPTFTTTPGTTVDNVTGDITNPDGSYGGNIVDEVALTGGTTTPVDTSIAIEDLTQPSNVGDFQVTAAPTLTNQTQITDPVTPIQDLPMVTTSVNPATGEVFDAQTGQEIGNLYDEVALTGTGTPEQQEGFLQNVLGRAGQTVDNALNELGKVPGAVVDFAKQTVDVFGRKLNVGKTLASAAINKLAGGPISLVFDAISNIEPSVSQIEYESYNQEQKDAIDKAYGPGGVMEGYNAVSAFGKGPLSTVQERLETRTSNGIFDDTTDKLNDLAEKLGGTRIDPPAYDFDDTSKTTTTPSGDTVDIETGDITDATGINVGNVFDEVALTGDGRQDTGPSGPPEGPGITADDAFGDDGPSSAGGPPSGPGATADEGFEDSGPSSVSTAGQAGPPSQRGGGGNGGSSSGGGGCVIATHAVNSGAFTKDTKREAVRWCIKNLHRTWWGEAIRRGYRYYGQKAIEEGKAKNHYQEFKDYVAFGTGKRRTLKTGWTFVYRSIQFFIRGLIND